MKFSILEWVAIPFSRGSSQPSDQMQIESRSPTLQVDSSPAEPPQKPKSFLKMSSDFQFFLLAKKNVFDWVIFTTLSSRSLMYSFVSSNLHFIPSGVFSISDILFFISGFSLYFLTLCCCCCSVAQTCPTLCNPMKCYTLSFPDLHYLPQFAQTHVH